MANTVSKKSSLEDSAANNPDKPPPGDKTLGLEPEIRLYAVEDGDETKEG